MNHTGTISVVKGTPPVESGTDGTDTNRTTNTRENGPAPPGLAEPARPSTRHLGAGMQLIGDIRCLCGGPLRLGEWGGNDQQHLSTTECEVCRTRLAVYVRLEVLPDVTGEPGGLAISDPRHGTENGYLNLGCRCPRCVAAHSQARKARSERRRSELGVGT